MMTDDEINTPKIEWPLESRRQNYVLCIVFNLSVGVIFFGALMSKYGLFSQNATNKWCPSCLP